jgi:hypothetical protein
MSETFDPKDYVVGPEELAELPKLQAKSSKRSAKKSEQGIEFYQFPKPVLVAILRSDYMPTLAVTAVIHETWYKGYQRNPITLTSVGLREFRISKGQKSRALKILEQSGWFDVKRSSGRNPLITLKWLRTTD